MSRIRGRRVHEAGPVSLVGSQCPLADFGATRAETADKTARRRTPTPWLWRSSEFASSTAPLLPSATSPLLQTAPMLSPLQLWRTRKLSLFGRSLFLSSSELLANLLLWCTTVALLAPIPERRSVLSLALIAWTLGLRHGLGESSSLAESRRSS